MIRRGMIIAAVAQIALCVPAGLAVAQPAHHATHQATHHTKHHAAAYGTVVNWRGQSHTATVARAGGALVAVHVSRKVAAGTTVTASHVTPLANATYSGTLTGIGHATTTRINGVVVAVLGHHQVAIGATGTTFVMRIPESVGALPQVGATVQAIVRVGHHGDLIATWLQDVTAPQIGIPGLLSGVVQVIALGTSHNTMVVSIDNAGTPTDVTVIAPAGIDISQYQLNEVVVLLAVDNGDGTYTLVQPLSIEGTVSAIDTSQGTLLVTNSSGGTTLGFTVHIPSSVGVTSFSPGDEVQLEVYALGDGTYSLMVGSANATPQQANTPPEVADGNTSGFGAGAGNSGQNQAFGSGTGLFGNPHSWGGWGD